MTRKPRSDAKLLTMPPHQQDTLAGWLLDEGMAYKTARERLRDDFNVETSEAALVEFWRAVCAPRRLRRSAAAASALPELSDALEVDWERPTMALIQQSVFEMLSQPGVDPQAVSFLGGILEKAKSRALKERELEAKISGGQLKFEQKERELKLNQEKFLASLRTKLEQGTAALLEEIKGNPRAVALFETLKAEMEAAQPE